MKKIIDNFSRQSALYKKYRPRYPKELYECILSFVKLHDVCWDCGTGNGQIAIELSKSFQHVYASDISVNQISLAEENSNITYSVERAEQTSFDDDTFNLITVGQAIHWFDFKAFNKEVKRVSKNDGIICIWGYGLLRIEEGIDSLIDTFYTAIIGSYWNKERKHIDNNYESVDFDFKELESPKDLKIDAKWYRKDLIGYLNSWSSVQHYLKLNNGKNPIGEIETELTKLWKDDEVKDVEFPLFMRIGVIEK